MYYKIEKDFLFKLKDTKKWILKDIYLQQPVWRVPFLLLGVWSHDPLH